MTPDITIVKFEDHFEILLNEFAYPKIRVNRYYLKLLRSDCDRETKKYLSDKLKQIEETQGHIERRGNTLMELAKFLLERQRDFFEHGEQGIRPLKMKDAAAAMNVHESTVSRAVRDKGGYEETEERPEAVRSPSGKRDRGLPAHGGKIQGRDGHRQHEGEKDMDVGSARKRKTSAQPSPTGEYL